jgi:hypothetical protein
VEIVFVCLRLISNSPEKIHRQKMSVIYCSPWPSLVAMRFSALTLRHYNEQSMIRQGSGMSCYLYLFWITNIGPTSNCNSNDLLSGWVGMVYGRVHALQAGLQPIIINVIRNPGNKLKQSVVWKSSCNRLFGLVIIVRATLVYNHMT